MTKNNEGAIVVGCLAGCACLMALIAATSLIAWLGLIPSGTTRDVMNLFIMLFAFGLAGYVACRRATATSWAECLGLGLIVGLAAEIFVVCALYEKVSLREIINHPGRLAILALTIPAAMLGGVIYKKTSRVQPADKEQPEQVSTDDGPENTA